MCKQDSSWTLSSNCQFYCPNLFAIFKILKSIYLALELHQLNFKETILLMKKNICFLETVTAAASIANIVKSSLGPVGLDKMLVDDIGVSKSCFMKLSVEKNLS